MSKKEEKAIKVEVIGGFIVKTLPPKESTGENKICSCWGCGTYGTRKDMIVKNHRYYCERCKDR